MKRGATASGHRVAVVGGGIFGVTAALHLARAGHAVDLFEAAPELLHGASGVNQRRLHHGYHYPRSSDTVEQVREGVASFCAEYPDAVRSDYEHYVAIASRDSLVSAEQYLQFCDRMGLEYRHERPPFLRPGAVDLSLRVPEQAVDLAVLRASARRKLDAAGVAVHVRSPRRLADLDDYERVVLATYASLNHLQAAIRGGGLDYQYEVCEKPVVRLPREYHNRSLVVLDGPFMCVDPYDGTGTFLLGNVTHAIHATTVGRYPLIPAELAGLLDGRIHHTPHSKFASFVEHARPFLTGIERAEHIGSLFTVRAVLPHIEDTDARPTVVRRLDDRVVSIFGGKIATSVEAAREVVTQFATAAPTEQDAWQLAR
ncbi:FAD-dependent oxidoreductase [Dactylosporangium matsuzakiense]|uniref:FAD-dependent oxidoreductase n=1 Tax=Dactylosporangium matsuzakiense TaxID=53360 RepID=UPI0021C2B9B3|nr:FAD-dependent oxidoreductase [Dactylosporangium matsuzakiense]